MPNFHYYQQVGGEEVWRPFPTAALASTLAKAPVFVTVLAVSKLVEDLTYEDKLKLTYSGPLYFDWDSEDEGLVIEKANAFLDKLEALSVDLEMCRLYATGGRGYHLEIPMELFISKPNRAGVAGLPAIYREIALELCVDTLDLRVYSGGKGRMWRVPNVRRPNGRYKVPITVTEMREMTPELCVQLTRKPRDLLVTKSPQFCPDLSISYSRAQQKVEDLLKRRAKFKPDPKAVEKASGISIQMAMDGVGLKDDLGFQEISTQLAIAATTAGMKEDDFVNACAGLIASHQSDGNRYNTDAKRAEELRRMHRYMDGNMCYEFSIGAIKKLLFHSAPDLDGMHVTVEEVKEVIAEASLEESTEMDEYHDVAKGISLARHGIYKDTEFGKKRICAVSFANSAVLRSSESCQIVGYDTDVLVNGVRAGRQMLELDVFAGLMQFNRFAARYGHAFTGTDIEVRTVMMRFVEQGKKKGSTMYVLKREGLDVVSIPHHENPAFREPFLVWADAQGVVTDDHIASSGLELTYQGFPDPRGVFKTDIGQAPALADWVREPGNKAEMKRMLQNLMSCQKPDLMGKLLGWYVSCFWKQLFQKVYGKFPLLHVNGAAGVGKCLGKDTPVLMADGSVKLVQDVRLGDRLLGPDGGVRNVLSTCSGQEQLYRIDPVKGDSYVVNASHILSLRKSEKHGITLADGTSVREDADVVNVNVEVFAESNKSARKSLKGWRSGPIEFHRPEEAKHLPPYALGLWLGDGKSVEPSICKPGHTQAVRWWKAYARSMGCEVSEYAYRDGECPSWYIKKGARQERNPVWDALESYGLFGNKHIPDAYKYASLDARRRLIAGMLDSDGHLIHSNYDWISCSQSLAEDFAFLCRSVGLACYVKPVKKGLRTLGFEGDYWRCCVSGDTHLIPCLDKKAAPREQVKRVTVTGIEVVPLGVGDYFGFTLDGDHLFMLGDFTVTHNTETNILLGSLFSYQQEVRTTSPASTVFAMQTQMTASSSIPLIIDEYKPHEMHRDLHNRMKAMFRDAYNQRDITRGGGTRESDDYRSLNSTQLSSPLVFIAEAAEEEAAVMERVVLATFGRPAASTGLKNLAKFQAARQHHEMLGILGQYLAAQIVSSVTLETFRAEFDALYEVAKRRYMLTQEDLDGDLPEEELRNKQNAKERSVYNHTVAKFGFSKFRELINSALGSDLDNLMGQLEDGIYARLADLHAATTPEHIKVLAEMSSMSHHVDRDRPEAIRLGFEYAFSTRAGSSCIEIALRPAYQKYRQYCRSSGLVPLYSGVESLMHSVKDSPAFISFGDGQGLPVPQVYVFDVDELAKYGVDLFRSR